MANNQPPACLSCGAKGPCGGRGLLTLKDGAWTNNPLAIQILGICSALAVTNRLENSLVTGWISRARKNGLASSAHSPPSVTN